MTIDGLGRVGQSEPRPPESMPLVALLIVLTITTGLIDAVSMLGLGRVFTANMTGNVVFLGFALAGTPGFSADRSLVSLAAFLVGAVAGGSLAARLECSRARWLLTAALIETGLLAAAAVVSGGYDPERLMPVGLLYTLIALTAVAMGVRNATMRRLSIPDLTTTVLTLTLTGLGADSSLARGSNPRWSRRLTSAVAILGGAGLGAALVLRKGLTAPLALTAAITLGSTIAYAALAAPPVESQGMPRAGMPRA